MFIYDLTIKIIYISTEDYIYIYIQNERQSI